MAKTRREYWQKAVVITVALLAVLAYGSWYYFSQVYLKPQNVFWATIDQNLRTASVTKTTTQNNGDYQTSQQVTDLRFKADLLSRSIVTINNNSSGANNKVATETIGTPTQDYLRYNEIKSGTVNQLGSATNIWAVNGVSSSQDVQILGGELLASPVLFGYLNSSQRLELINQMKKAKVFDIDYSAVNTIAKYKNKTAYSYKVTINLANYLPIYKSYLNMLGQEKLVGQISDAGASGSYVVTMLIYPATRQLVQATIEGSTYQETYSNYNVNTRIGLPSANISISNLQQRLMVPTL